MQVLPATLTVNNELDDTCNSSGTTPKPIRADRYLITNK